MSKCGNHENGESSGTPFAELPPLETRLQRYAQHCGQVGYSVLDIGHSIRIRENTKAKPP